jgi:hypothetical protein
MHGAPPDGSPAREPRDYVVHHDHGSAADLSTTVVHALAEAMGVDVTATEFRLYDVVDPDALDRLVGRRERRGSGPGGHVAFQVEGYRVTVYSDGRIVVTPPGA